ncbi:MAG: glycosyltransferase [Bacilli bacterium]|nr:glycosyltransferase [Bacilli bacterium]
MKICIVAPVHQYDDVRIFKKEAISLHKKGYDVILYARIDEETCVDGISVKPYKYRNRFFRFIKMPLLLYKIILEKADAYHLHNPDTIPLGLFLKLFKKKVVYDTHENFKIRIMNRNWIPKPLRKIVSNIIDLSERIMSSCANYTIVTQEGQLNKFKRSVLINNSPIVNNDNITNTIRRSEEIDDKSELRLIYLGVISEDRGSLKMLELVHKLNEITESRLWLLGQVAEQKIIDNLKTHKGWKYVDYLGRLPQEEAFSYLAKSSVALIILQDKEQYEDTSPNKLFEYLMYGIPFIASDFPNWKNQIDSIKAGYFVNPKDVNEIIEKILYLKKNPDVYSRMRSVGPKYVLENFNWGKEEIKLYEIYERLLN